MLGAGHDLVSRDFLAAGTGGRREKSEEEDRRPARPRERTARPRRRQFIPRPYGFLADHVSPYPIHRRPSCVRATASSPPHQKAIQAKPKIVLLSCALRPFPSKFVLPPLNFS